METLKRKVKMEDVKSPRDAQAIYDAMEKRVSNLEREVKHLHGVIVTMQGGVEVSEDAEAEA